MPYTVRPVEEGPWIAVEFHGPLHPADMVAARREGASLNPGGRYRNVLIDFSEVSEFVFTLEARDAIRAVNRERAALLDGSRCALVYTSGTVGFIARLVAYTSGLNTEFRHFEQRGEAERWLSGEQPGTGRLLSTRRTVNVGC